ncbi:MAG: cyclase family protein [Gammaproteobacteria bacterium]|nr:MAG: cyclase family protein [Gammaproteobacteria bacterium]RLA33316.1 MAG: cyclase family protein [Gammaproteobacteria bacterium]
MRNRIFICVLVSFLCSPVFALDLDAYQLVDLSHTYDKDTLYWPTSPSAFEKTELSFGEVEGGYFYSAYTVCTPEHGGTHLDAPIHFAAGGASTEQIPLENLIAPAIVIDVSEQAAADRNYRLSVADVRRFEAQHGEIAQGTIVLLRTGWSQYWPDANGYLGDDKPGDASNLEFPGFGAEAVRLLAEDRRVAVLGVDSASIDYGPSQDFIAHRIAAAAGVVNLENLTNLDQLPATGATILALPMKIGGGSGGPARVVALVPK